MRRVARGRRPRSVQAEEYRRPPGRAGPRSASRPPTWPPSSTGSRPTPRRSPTPSSAVADNVQSKRAQFQDARRRRRPRPARRPGSPAAEEQRLEDQIVRRSRTRSPSSPSSAYIRPPESDDGRRLRRRPTSTTRRWPPPCWAPRTTSRRDVIDQLDAAEDDLTAQRVAAEAGGPGGRAPARPARTTRSASCARPRSQQRELARQVDERINQATGRGRGPLRAGRGAVRPDRRRGRPVRPVHPGHEPRPGRPVVPERPGLASPTPATGSSSTCSIVDQIHNMIVAAANDGVTLTGGGYRDSAQQIALRQAHCGCSDYAIYQAPSSSCSPPTAIPGTSMHEQGLAIDFDNCSYGTSVYNWLSGQRRQLRPLQPAVRVLALEHHRRLSRRPGDPTQTGPVDLSRCDRPSTGSGRSSALATLVDYIRIPAKSPAYDADWAEHGHLAEAVDLVAALVPDRDLPGATVEVLELRGAHAGRPGRRPGPRRRRPRRHRAPLRPPATSSPS